MRYLPLLMTWYIWLLRNRVIFEDLYPSSNHTIHIIKEQLSKHKVKVHSRTPINLFGLSLVYDFPIRFLDGASALSKGGVGVHLMLNKDHYLFLKLGCGLSTNTRSELLALWVLLSFSKHIGLPYLHIRGDSSAIINWFNGLASLETLDLSGWCKEISNLRSYFIHLESACVFTEFNIQVDRLSKEALHILVGILEHMEYIEGACIEHGSAQLF